MLLVFLGEDDKEGIISQILTWVTYIFSICIMNKDWTPSIKIIVYDKLCKDTWVGKKKRRKYLDSLKGLLFVWVTYLLPGLL